MGTSYRLDVLNKSSDFHDFCMYQTDPDIGVPDVQSLAWLTDRAWPSTVVSFEWTIDYSFTWAEVDTLVPGVVFRASQVWPADPSSATGDAVVFDFQRGAYTFAHGDPAGHPKQGSLYIRQTPNVPLNDASVGIGMSGAGTFAREAEPNMNLVFTPHPAYWLTAGTYEKGEVLDITEISNAVQVQFPPGIFRVEATFHDDNTWSVSPRPA